MMATDRNQYVSVSLIYKSIMNRNIDIKDIDLIEQVIYLANHIYGIYFGNLKFVLKNNSPFSPSLALLVDDYSEREDLKEEMFQLKEHVHPYLDSLKKVFFDKKPEEYSIEEWIKLIAFINYQWEIARWDNYGQWKKIKNQGIEKVMHFIGDKLFVIENCPYKRKEITKCIKILLQNKLISLN